MRLREGQKKLKNPISRWSNPEEPVACNQKFLWFITLNQEDFMKKTKSTLNKLYYFIYNIHRWTHLISLSEEFDQEDLRYLEFLDRFWIAFERKAGQEHQEWRRTELPRLSKELKKEAGEDYCRERRIEFLEGQRNKLIKEIDQIYKNYQESIEKDVNSCLRRAVLAIMNPQHLERKLKSVGIELHILKNPGKKEEFRKLTSQDIAKASNVPFENLIRFNKAGFAFCPFHNEKTPSFHLIKGSNYAYCFGCGWKGDPINFLMERDGISFYQAVKKLNCQL